MNQKISSILAVFFVCLALLTGCQGEGFAANPQNAVIDRVNTNVGPDVVIRLRTLVVHQTQVVSNRTFVLVSYQQTRDEVPEQCVSMYEARRELGGWHAGSGGGGCGPLTTDTSETAPQVDWNSGTTSSSDPGDRGVSAVNGLVHDARIQSVRVTWDDTTQQTAALVNSSFLIVRIGGQFQPTRLEGLAQDGTALYDSQPMAAPGKP